MVGACCGNWPFLGLRGETGQYQGVANKALQPRPKMLVSKGLGGKLDGLKRGCPTIFWAVLGVVVRCCEEMGYVEIFCWTGFWGWRCNFEVVLGKGFASIGRAEVVFLSGDTV